MHIESDEFQSHYHLPEIKVYVKQWAKGYHPVFSAAALMNPAYHSKFGYTELWDDQLVLADMKKMMARFFLTSAAKHNAMAQLSQYKRQQGVCALAPCLTRPGPAPPRYLWNSTLQAGVRQADRRQRHRRHVEPRRDQEDGVARDVVGGSRAQVRGHKEELREFAIYVHSIGTSIGDVERLHSLFTKCQAANL